MALVGLESGQAQGKQLYIISFPPFFGSWVLSPPFFFSFSGTGNVCEHEKCCWFSCIQV